MDIQKVLIFLLVIICFFVFVGCGRVQYNNSSYKDELITKTYSVEDIVAFEEGLCVQKFDWKQFKRMFKVECVRETYQGSYVILSLHENKNAFIFFDQEGFVYNVIIMDGFKSKEEFETQVVVGQSTLEQVVSFDPSTTGVPVSRVTSSAHIVQEGAFLVVYSRRKDRVLLDEPIVDSVQFFSNQDILSSEDDFVRLMIPYVLEMDKFSGQGTGSLVSSRTDE